MAVAKVTVKQLAKVVGIPVERLLGQLTEAGLDIHDADQAISEDEKLQFLEFLRKNQSQGASASKAATASDKKITLKRKEVSQLSLSKDAGKRKTVNIEVRKRRTYTTPGIQEETPEEIVVEETLTAVVNETTQDSTGLPIEAQASSEAIANEVLSEEAVSENEANASEQLELETVADLQVTTATDEKGKVKKTDKIEPKPSIKSEAELAEEEKERKKKLAVKAKLQPKHLDKKAIFEALDETVEDEEDIPIVDVPLPQAVKKVPPITANETRPQLRSKLLKKHSFAMPKAPQVYEVKIPDLITVAELAKRMSVKASEVIKILMNMGVMANINQALEQDTAVLVVEELGHKPRLVNESALEESLVENLRAQDYQGVPRAPVVTIMGHVDHGKTSLLDYIRTTKVAAGEAGGITQHIGAYHVKTPSGADVTFLDTPGHEAFTAMRARGAQATDIVVLVVAADDGVKPQTIEAIQHCKAGGVPMIVAINKMDKPGADPDKVKNDLSVHNVMSEDWGGDTQFIPISALTGDGVDNLLEAISLQSEILELTARGEGLAEGVVLESRLDKSLGAVATILVQQGVLQRGDILLAGTVYGRVRAMLDETGTKISKAGPSIPVQVLGLTDVPKAGDDVLVVANERKAREVAQHRLEKEREAKALRHKTVTLDNLFASLDAAEKKELNIVLKADVQGSLEAITDALIKISNDEVAVRVISSGVGGITESDINLAMASSAIVFGFNVRADSSAKQLVEQEKVDLHYYSIIYEIVDEVKQALSGMLSPEIREEIVGTAEVRDVFRSPKFGSVAGCMVIEGLVKRSNPIRVLRDNVVIYEGVLESLRRFKDDANEVRQGYECGIAVKNYNDVKPGDQIEVYERKEIKRVIE